jgi:hypothetical protein
VALRSRSKTTLRGTWGSYNELEISRVGEDETRFLSGFVLVLGPNVHSLHFTVGCIKTSLLCLWIELEPGSGRNFAWTDLFVIDRIKTYLLHVMRSHSTV